MEKFLDITPGSVSVLGLMNDKQNNVKLLVDRDVLSDEYIGCHPCINTTSMKVRMSDIFDKFINATGHEKRNSDFSLFLLGCYGLKINFRFTGLWSL